MSRKDPKEYRAYMREYIRAKRQGLTTGLTSQQRRMKLNYWSG